MMKVYYKIHHINGEFNYLTDLDSRWVNPFAYLKVHDETEDVGGYKRGLRGGPLPLTRVIADRSGGCAEAAPKRVQKLSHTKLTSDVETPDLDIHKAEGLIMPSMKTLVDRDLLAASQGQHVEGKSAVLKLERHTAKRCGPRRSRYGHDRCVLRVSLCLTGTTTRASPRQGGGRPPAGLPVGSDIITRKY